MATDPLAILFGNAARVKLLRFFVFNPSKVETFDEISKRARLVRRTARTEMSILEKAGVVKKKTIYIAVPDKDKKMKAVGHTLDKAFPNLPALQSFLFATAPINGKTLLRHLRTAGSLDFVAAAGVFQQEFEHRLDVMVTMKKLDENKVANAIRSLEAELGIDIKFAAMTTEDLRYRIGMHDKLIRDVFDYSHEILVDKTGIRSELGLF
jgi:hypothetical protein